MILANETIKENYYHYTNYLHSIEKFIDLRFSKPFIIVSKGLKIAASRVTVPKPFEPYIKIIQEKLNKPFPTNLQFTVEEVRETDLSILKAFSVSNIKIKNINLDLLIEAAKVAASELGILTGVKHSTLNAEDSARRYANNTSAGYPTFKQKGTYTAVSDAVNWCQKEIEEPTLLNFLKQPTAVFHRFQYKAKIIENRTDLVKKIRPVWGVSFRVLAFEGFLFRNLVENVTTFNQKSTQPITSIGRTKFQISRDIIAHLRTYSKSIVSVDYSLFDSTVPSYFWALFYAIIKECINLSAYTDNHLKCMLAFHCFTPYCWNSTVLKFQRRGVPSGCLMTSLFDTWVNRTIINYAFLEYSNGKSLPGRKACCLGDDLVFVEDGITYKHFLDVTKRLGMTVQVEKSSIYSPKESFNFLGYTWNTFNEPTQSQDWYVAHLCMPSRFYRNYPFPISVLQTYRGISICMSLKGGMEMFEYLVGWSDFVWIDLLKRYYEGEPTIITYIGEDMRDYGLRIPLSVILTDGWVAF